MGSGGLGEPGSISAELPPWSAQARRPITRNKLRNLYIRENRVLYRHAGTARRDH